MIDNLKPMTSLECETAARKAAYQNGLSGDSANFPLAQVYATLSVAAAIREQTVANE